MKPTIYICHNCPSCQRIIDYIDRNNVKCEIVNVSDDANKAPEVGIFPALFINDKLKAYGNDILERL